MRFNFRCRLLLQSILLLGLFTAVVSAQDQDGDGDVDRDDVQIILAARNQPAAPGDPRDLDADGVITVLDARLAVVACTRDGCNTEDDNLPQVDLNGSNDAGDDFTAAFSEGGGPVSAVDVDMTLTDADMTDSIDSGMATLTNPLDSPDETLAVDVTGTSIVASFVPGTGVLTLTGPDTVANFQQVLRTLTYDNASLNPNVTDRIIQVKVTDSGSDSNVAVSTIQINASNDPPEVDLNGAGAGLDVAAAFVEDGGPVVLGAGVTVVDVDDTQLQTATVTITNLLDGAAEALAADVTGTSVTSAFAAGILTLTGPDTLANFQQVLATVTYDNTSDDPDVTDRAVTFIVNDAAAASAPATATVSLAAVNDPPQLDLNGANDGGAGFMANFVEGGGPVSIVDVDLTVLDLDSPTLQSATVTIANLLDGASEALAANVGGTAITSAFAGGILTLTGPDSLANFQQVLRTLTYDNASAAPTTTARNVEFVGNDGSDPSVVVTSVVTINGVNDPPQLDLNGANDGGDGFAAAFQQGAGPVSIVDVDLSITDVDSANMSSAAVSISNPQDGASEVLAVSPGACGALTVVPGLNSLSVSGVDSIANYETCLRGVTYEDTSGTPTVLPNRSVNFTVNDGSDTSNVAVSTVTILPNQDPTANAQTPSTAEDVPLTITLTGSDPDGDVLAFSILSGPSSGSLGPLTQMPPTSAEVVYTPNADFNGSDALTFQVDDGNGGTAMATVDITINPVNDPPTITAIGNVNAIEDQGLFNVPFTVNDIDGDSMTVTVTMNTVPAVASVTIDVPAGMTANRNAQVTPQPNAVGNTLIELTVDDGNTGMASETFTVTVSGLDDAPGLAVGGALAYNEDDPATAISPALTVTELDGDSFKSATVSIGAGFVAAEDVLSCLSPMGLTCVFNAVSGTLDITGIASAAVYQAVLRDVAYVNTDTNNPTEGARSLTYQVTDDTVAMIASNVLAASVTVTAVNDAPQATADGFDWVGNAQLTVPVASGVLANDSDVDNTAAELMVDNPGTRATTRGGSVTIAADGSFTFVSAPGDSGVSDTFTYDLTDGTNVVPGVVVTIDLLGTIWFVDNTAAVNGNGTQASPFNVLSDGAADVDATNDAEDASQNGDIIYLFQGNSAGAPFDLEGGITLDDDQLLIGEGVALQVDPDGPGPMGPVVLAPANTAEQPVITNSTAENNGNGVILGDNSRVQGITVDGATGHGFTNDSVAITGTASFNTVSSVNNGMDGFNIDNTPVAGAPPALAVSFQDVNVQGNTGDGISLTQVNGAVTFLGAAPCVIQGNGGFGLLVDDNSNIAAAQILDLDSVTFTDNMGGQMGVLNGDRTVTVDTSTLTGDVANAVAGPAVRLDGTSGPVTFTGTTLTYTGNRVVDILDTNTVGGGQISFSGAAGSLTGTNGTGILVMDTPANVTFDHNLTNISGGTAGITLTDTTGTFTFSNTSVSMVSTTGGTAIAIDGISAAANFSATTNVSSNARIVSVANTLATGDVTFNAASFANNGGSGILYDNAAGDLTLGNYNAAAATGFFTRTGAATGAFTLNGAANNVTQTGGTAFSINSGTGNATFMNLTLSQTGGALIDINNAATGNILFNGTSDLDNLNGSGIQVQNGGPVVTLPDAVVTNGTQGILLNNFSGTYNHNSGSVSVADASANPALSVQGGTPAAVIALAGGLTKRGNGRLINIGGTTAVGAGSVNLTGSANVTQDGAIAGPTGVLVQNTTANVTIPALSVTGSVNGIDIQGGSGTFSFTGTTTLNSSTTSGVNINGGSAPVNFATLNITSTVGTALNGTNSTGVVTVTGGTVDHEGGRILDFDNMDGGAAIGAALDNTNAGAGGGIQISNSQGGHVFTGAVTVTGAARAIDLDANAVNTIDFQGTTTLNNSSSAGIDILGGSAPLTFTSLNITSTAGTAFLGSASTGTVTVNGGTITHGGGRIVDFDNMDGGADFTGSTFTATNSATLANNHQGVLIDNGSNGTFSFPSIDTSPSSGVTPVQLQANAATSVFQFGLIDVSTLNAEGVIHTGGGTLSVSNVLSRIDGNGDRAILLDGITLGAVNFDDIFANPAGGQVGLDFNNVSTGTFSLSGEAVVSTASIGIDITNSSASFTFADVDISSTSGDGINLDNNSGTMTFNDGDAGVDITGAAGIAFDLNAGTVNVTFDGDITNTAGRSVEVTNRGGGTADFNGFVSDSGTGIFLDNNDQGGNGTARFDGGMNLNTGTSTAFTATNGGTVIATQNNTTITNVVTTTTGIGVRIENTTVGAAGVTFRSVSVNGASNGILLNTTGSSGTFTVSGDGSMTAGVLDRDGSGGIIQSTTDDGVSLNSANGVVLRQMNILSVGNAANPADTNTTTNDHAVESRGGGNIVLSAVHIQDPIGTGWEAFDITGVNRIDNGSLIEQLDRTSNFNGVRVRNTNTNFTSFTIDNTTVDHADPTPATAANNGNSMVVFSARGTTSGTWTASNSTFTGARGQAMTIGVGDTGGSSGTVTTNVTGNIFQTSHAINGQNNLGINTLEATTQNVNISGNTFQDVGRGLSNSGQIIVQKDDTAILDASISSNTISQVTAQRGIEVLALSTSTGGRVDAEIFSNLIHGIGREGVFISARGSEPDMDVRIFNNTIGRTSVGGPISAVGGQNGGPGILVDAQANSALDVQIDGNDVVAQTATFGSCGGSNCGVVTINVENFPSGTALVNATVENNTLNNNNAGGTNFLARARDCGLTLRVDLGGTGGGGDGLANTALGSTTTYNILDDSFGCGGTAPTVAVENLANVDNDNNPTGNVATSGVINFAGNVQLPNF